MSQTTIPTCNNTSVGVIVWHPNRQFILMQQRAKPPYGIACPAGHVEEQESYTDAGRRELREETGLQAVSLKFLLGQRLGYTCRRPGGNYHRWGVYEAQVQGILTPKPDEVLSLGWYSLQTIEALSDRTNDYRRGFLNDLEWQQSPGLELVWQDIFVELGILSDVSFF
jgi:8-oxo-dGTP pyrophosphatase MutT (NUDIX family)